MRARAWPACMLPLVASAVLAVAGSAPARPPSAAGPTRTAAAAIAGLRLVSADGEYLAYADNLLPGPIEVMLHADGGRPLPADPPLPARASVPALGSVLVARLQVGGGRSINLPLRLDAIPGSSNARPRDIEYAAPLQQREGRIDQGFDGEFSHADDQNRYALDFAAAIGTPVLAARAGTVMQVESRFRAGGLAYRDYAGRANFIRVLHEDGTMALYAHLAADGVLVRPGQQVEVGQRIGLSGNTGYSTAPHLHFAVQVNRGMRLLSIPFRMRGLAPPP